MAGLEYSGPGISPDAAAQPGIASASLRLLEASAWCILLLDGVSAVSFINSAGLSLFEFGSVGDVVGKAFRDLWPAAEHHTLAAALEKARGGETGQIKAFCPTAKGNPRWLEAAVTRIEPGADQPGSLMCSIRDITEQFADRESLRNSEQRFRALTDHMAQLAWMADQTGHIFWYNKRWFDFTGTSMPEMEGWGWEKVHHPDHLERVVQKFAAHIQSGEVWEDIFPLRGADGAYRWFLSQALPFRDAAGRVVLWCGTNTDITEQRNATQRLRQKARLIELSHEAIFSWDLDGAILSWNRGCEELYGYAQSEAIGAISHELLKSQHPVPLPEMRNILLADGAWSGEILHFAKDGTKVWVDSRHEVLKVGGKLVVLETNRDITERRKSDEIRNLLVAELNHRVKNTLAIVQSIAAQTARSSSNTPDFVASFRGRLQSLASAHNVLTDAHWYGADLRHLVQAEIDVTIGQPANVKVRGEPVFLPPQTALHFTLMLHELATNALKHGALTAEAGRVEVSWDRMAHEPHKLELLWREIGGPGVVAPRRKGFGTALIARSGGLPDIKATLDFNPDGVQCRIVADLKDEKSAEPVLFNPIRAEIPLTSTPRSGGRPAARGPKRRVLVIESEPLIALELEETLIESGYVPLGPATTPESAFEAIKRGGADAAIVDATLMGVHLPAIVAKLDAAGLPYVMVRGANPMRGEPVLDGAPMLTRPIRPAALVQALSQVVTAKTSPDAAM